MRDYRSNEVRNVCVVGHIGSGKTSLLESVVRYSDTLERFVGNRNDNILDVDSEEIKRGMSIYASIIPIEWENKKINFIDTPGYVDFIGEYEAGCSIADSALLVIDGKNPVSGGCKRIWKDLVARKMPSLLFINKLDDPEVQFESVYAQLREELGNMVFPFEVPIVEGQKIVGTVNILSKKAWYYEGPKASKTQFYEVPDTMKELVDGYCEQIMESIAMSDDALMEKYFSGESFSEEELSKGLSLGIRSGDIHPIYSGSATQMVGIQRLLTLINENFPLYGERAHIEMHDYETGVDKQLRRSEDEEFSALVFKTTIDPFVGKISYVKVKSGVLTSDALVYNANKDALEKVGQIFVVKGKHQTAVGKLFSGDIGVITKLDVSGTNDTLCAKNRRYALQGIRFSTPMFVKAILPKSKNDEDKLNSSLQKMTEEDATFHTEYNAETKQNLVYAIGDQHLDVILTKMKAKYKVDVSLELPKIPYRETIRTKSIGEGRHKKQTGGHGQFAHVFVEFEPVEEADELIFDERVFGGAIPRNYFPAVEAGLMESMHKGVLGGFKVVNVKATLFDGKYHDVDSSEMAFKLAARLAYKDGIAKAKPILLEPYVRVKVLVDDEYTGAIIGDLNKRRGAIEGMELVDDAQVIIAKVPYSEMLEYAMDLRQMSQGSATYEQELSEYLPVPSNIAEKVLENVQVEED
ncbi:MAG: elongation factor G [Erysipelotrichaceae bacterium]